MLRKMRLRVIVAVMLAFAAVITLIAVLVNVVNGCVVTRRMDETVASILRFETGTARMPPSGPFMVLPDVESNYMIRFFVVRTDNAGQVLSVSTDYVASVDRDEAERYAAQALKHGAERGTLREYRYGLVEQDGGRVLVFLNISREQQYIRTLGLLTLAVSGGSLLLVFALVVLLSTRAIRPYARQVQKQKQFITDASHELKTPLTSISASLDVLALEHGEDEWTENIRAQTARMTRLVSKLVTLSRLDEELPLPHQEPFSLSNAAWEIAEVYQPQARAGGKTLQVEAADEVTLIGDRGAIRQMLSVLLDNAIRYSLPGSAIRLRVCRRRGRCEIEVCSACHLDPPPDTSRLFDRFYRPDSSRSTGTGGTGIGLAIARAVAEAHGGTITAHCPDGTSMTIRIIL